MKGVVIISKFSQLNQDINKVLDKLVSNQDLCKYLYYKTDNPISEEDIDDTTSLLFTKIFPFPTTTEIFKDSDGNPVADIVINVLFDDFKLGTKNNKFINGKLTFIVLCHMSLQRLSATSELRPICVLDQIDQMFSDQRLLGIGKDEFDGCRIVFADSDYSGYRFSIKSYEFA